VGCNAFVSHYRRKRGPERGPQFIRRVIGPHGVRGSKRGISAPHVLIRSAQHAIQTRGFPRGLVPSEHFQ
jgi:hypothetical protein